jgi:hypothetical protein
MTKAERDVYNKELRKVAKCLGLTQRGDLEGTIVQYCKNEVEKLGGVYGTSQTLSDLLAQVTTSLDLEVTEVYDDSDLEKLKDRLSPSEEPIVALLTSEFDDKTDAVLVQRKGHHPWERAYLAIINCRGWHSSRKYFSLWHEIAHLLIEGKQLKFAFRKTLAPEFRRDFSEIIVDRVAASIAFLPDIFEPALLDAINKEGLLTFEIINSVRKQKAPDASLTSSVLACIRYCPNPVYFIRARMGYKKDEERLLKSTQASLFQEDISMPVSKLRVGSAAQSPAMKNLAVRIHKNMEVPPSSVVAMAFEDISYDTHTGHEPLHEWQTSRGGPIGYGDIRVEAVRINEEVWALIHFVQNTNYQSH